jgi:hypothetical protein
MTRLDGWRRVSRQEPCPVCHKPGWCLVAGLPGHIEAAICPRTESERPIGEAGFLHILRSSPVPWPRWRCTLSHAVRLAQRPANVEALAQMAQRWRLPAESARLAALAEHLGVTAASLARLWAGWSQDRRAWTFPMKDAAGQVVGVRLRFGNGRKLSIKGGHEGLFLPDGLKPGGRLLLCEGPTDAAALLDLGFPAAGRPSCTGGTRHCIELVRRLKPQVVVVVADGDEPGQRGAERLAGLLRLHCRDVRIITPPPPHKDIRDWKRAGATAVDIEQAITAAPVCELKTTWARKGKTDERR